MSVVLALLGAAGLIGGAFWAGFRSGAAQVASRAEGRALRTAGTLAAVSEEQARRERARAAQAEQAEQQATADAQAARERPQTTAEVEAARLRVRDLVAKLRAEVDRES